MNESSPLLANDASAKAKQTQLQGRRLDKVLGLPRTVVAGLFVVILLAYAGLWMAGSMESERNRNPYVDSDLDGEDGSSGSWWAGLFGSWHKRRHHKRHHKKAKARKAAALECMDASALITVHGGFHVWRVCLHDGTIMDKHSLELPHEDMEKRPKHKVKLRGMTFLPDGRLLIANGFSKGSQIYDASWLHKKQRYEINGVWCRTRTHPYGLTHGHNFVLVSNQNSASVDMFNMTTGAFTERLFHDKHIHKARKARVRGIAVQERCDLAFIAVGHDHRITVVNVPSGEINGHLRVTRPIGVLLDQATDRLFVSAGDASFIYVYELVEPAEATRMRAKWRRTDKGGSVGMRREYAEARKMVGREDSGGKWAPPTCGGKAWALSQVLSFPGYSHAAGMALGHSGRLFVAYQNPPSLARFNLTSEEPSLVAPLPKRPEQMILESHNPLHPK